MSGSSQQTASTTQQTKSEPWGPAQPLLQNLIGQYSALPTNVTPGQQSAVNQIQEAARGVPTFDTTSVINNLLGTSTAPQVGMLNNAWNQTQNALTPITDPNNLNPYNTPGFSDALKTMTSDITNATKGVYAGSGRDPSGAGSFAQSLGRGLTQGIAPTIASQYNTNVGNLLSSAGMLNTGAINTSGAITGQQQIPLSNAVTALGQIPQVQQNALLPGQLNLNASTAGYQLPYANLSSLLGPAAAIGGLGGTTSGSGTTIQTTPQNTLSNVLGGISGGLGILGLLSDERAKDEVEEVGKLHDGQRVVRFRYHGDPTMRIGLLAQEVQEHEPTAVHKIPGVGLLAVDHRKATERAASIGRSKDTRRAA